jgi:hypothetical protein
MKLIHDVSYVLVKWETKHCILWSSTHIFKLQSDPKKFGKPIDPNITSRMVFVLVRIMGYASTLFSMASRWDFLLLKPNQVLCFTKTSHNGHLNIGFYSLWTKRCKNTQLLVSALQSYDFMWFNEINILVVAEIEIVICIYNLKFKKVAIQIS